MTTLAFPHEAFWAAIANQYVEWFKPWEKTFEGSFAAGEVKWFLGGQLNVSVNCLDRHLSTKQNEIALLWEGDDENQCRQFTFGRLHEEVCRMANALKALGIQKGDRVGIYLPMIPEAAIAMLACARIGAVHTVVFAGFSSQALKQRLEDAHCKLLITADSYSRGGKTFQLKEQADQASKGLSLKTLLIENDFSKVPFNPKTDHSWQKLREELSVDCPAEPMDAEDPLFILYTSGSTGKPKGLVHTTGGYLTQVAFSFDTVFACRAGDRFWCTADVGWITGHSYVVYGPLSQGITSLIFAGVPNWPTPGRYWDIIDRYQVNVLYTAPTAIRALKRAGNEWLENSSRRSLRLLGSVGEPINPEVWEWYQQEVGLGRCPVVDTWWQTETGAIMISPQSFTVKQKPGAACQPLPGIELVLLSDENEVMVGEGEGALAIRYPWPSLARTILGDHARYCETYFKSNYYWTGDSAKRDKDGDYWINGRNDDVLNVAGHRLGTAEIESALVSHQQVAEAAVVSFPHAIKGQAVYAFVALKLNAESSENQLTVELQDLVKQQIGAIAKPEVIRFVNDLPKTRSGKIMRRILRQIASNPETQVQELGDLSTLANPQVVSELLNSFN